MKKFLTFLILPLMFVSFFPVSASAETNAGIGPSSFFYFFDTTFENINLFFTFSSEKKAKKSLEYADERLAEATESANDNKPKDVEKAMADYEKKISLATEKSKELKDEKKVKELLNTISESTEKHQEVLESILENIPDEAREAILNAIEVSKKGQEKALKLVSELKKEVTKLKEEINLLKKQEQDSQDKQIEGLRKEIEALKSSKSPQKKQPRIIKVSAPVSKLSNSKIINKLKPAVVYIETDNSSGSGMIIERNGYILTNAHVVKGVTNVKVSLSTGKTIRGIVTGRDEAVDLAIIKVLYSQELPKIEFGDSNKTKQGDDVFTFGFPFGIEGDVSFKEGTISRRIEGYLETSAEIHPGNSGGPLVNVHGQVIGINTAILGKSIVGIQFGETIKLAIPVNIAIELIPDLKSGRNIIVESQEEKKAKQEAINKSACLAESEQYYQKRVSGIEQLNDPGLQSIISSIDQQIESVKQSLNRQISRATNTYDRLISERRAIAEKYLKSATKESLISSVNEKLGLDVANYEGQRQLLISSAQLNANTNIREYEAMKTKARSKSKKRKQASLENAKTDKIEYYNICMNR